jgi:hypothetical protein
MGKVSFKVAGNGNVWGALRSLTARFRQHPNQRSCDSLVMLIHQAFGFAWLAGEDGVVDLVMFFDPGFEISQFEIDDVAGQR